MYRWWVKNDGSPSWPESVKKYFELDHKYPKKTKIESIRFVVLDTETSGLTKNAQLVSIGWLVYQHNRIFLPSTVELKMPIIKGDKSSEIHGEISNLVSNQQYEKYAETFLEIMANSVLVGHSLTIDILMLNRWLGSIYPGIKITNSMLDTASLAVRSDPYYFQNTVGGKHNLQLDALCTKYKIPVEGRHTALGDAYITAQLFHKLLQSLAKRGCHTWHDLNR